jgi:hypothetical protein
MKFEGDGYCREILSALAADEEIRKPFRELLEQLRSKGEGNTVDAVAQFRSSKRGRKPSFSRAEGLGTMHQVTYLGAIEIQKAS